MSVGAIFLIIVIIVVLAVLGSVFFGFTRRQASREQHRGGDKLKGERGAGEDSGSRPEHVRTEDEESGARTFGT
jgi:hypothetical protein